MFEKSATNLAEENVVGGGAIAGVGVGPQGEPGVAVARRQARSRDEAKTILAAMLRRRLDQIQGNQ